MAVEPRGARARDQGPYLARHCDSDRVRQDHLGGREARGEFAHAPGVDPPLERTAEGDADRDGRRNARGRENPRDAIGRLRKRSVAVAPVELLGRAEGCVDPVEPSGCEALGALLVEDETRVLGGVAPFDPFDDLLRPRHLRHAVWPYEAHRLHPP